MCATNSLDNIFFERWIEPGMHLSSIKLPEIEVKAIKRADRIVIHSHDTPRSTSPPRISRSPETAEDRAGRLASELDFAKLPTLPEL